MPIPLPDGRCALSTVLVNRATGHGEILFERAGSYCHFAQEIRHREHIINLRVDWRDLVDGDPTLDADVYRIEADGRLKQITNRNWHQTRIEPTARDEVRCYAFQFQDLTLHLIARKSLAVAASLDAIIVETER